MAGLEASARSLLRRTALRRVRILGGLRSPELPKKHPCGVALDPWGCVSCYTPQWGGEKMLLSSAH